MNGEEIGKKIQFHKSYQIKEIVIKRIRTKCEEITKWRAAFIFCRVSVKIDEERGKEEKKIHHSYKG